MCTLILAWQVFEDAPVVAAANRDERLDRPSRPPHVIDTEPRVVAPQDDRAGGTWIGYNDAGVFVAITNRWTDDDLIGERSRGLLVRDALARSSAEEAARYVEREVDVRDYAGFLLVAADTNAAILLEWDGRMDVRNFEPGVHVVMNVGADNRFSIPQARAEAGERQVINAHRLRADLEPDPGEDADTWLDRTTTALADHEYGVCVHGDGYGTRSSSLIVITADGTATHRFADGPPCETTYEFVDETHLRDESTI